MPRLPRHLHWLIVTLLGAVAALAVASPAPAVAACSTAYTRIFFNAENGVFQANVTLTNTRSATTSGWTVRVVYVPGIEIGTAWNAVKEGDGSVADFRNGIWNAQIPPGGRVDFGFLATRLPRTGLQVRLAPVSVTCALA
jgi:hypothetical protein